MDLESARLSLPYLAAGQAQKELTHNEALALIDIGIAASAESMGINVPPASPSPGQCWVIGDASEGAWEAKTGDLACWTESGWRFLPSIEGMMVWVKDRQLWAVREAGGWVIGTARAERVLIGGMQVIGPRGAPVTAPTGGTVVDAEARAAIAAILDRMITHGLLDA